MRGYDDDDGDDDGGSSSHHHQGKSLEATDMTQNLCTYLAWKKTQ